MDEIEDALDRLLMEGYTPQQILAAAQRLVRNTQIVTITEDIGPRVSAPRVFEISTESGEVVVTADMPDEDQDHVEYARALLDAGGRQSGWYGLSTAHGPTNPDHIDYVAPHA